MPVSGWVVVCSPRKVSEIRSVLDQDPRVLVGIPQGAHLPIAFENDELDPWQRHREEWLAIDGVMDVALVSLDFSDVETDGLDAGPLMRRRRKRKKAEEPAQTGGRS